MWEGILLGLVQGLTEFLPVSSSAHLRIVGDLMGSGDPGATFTAITQIGTETAVLIYFRRDFWRILVAAWQALTGARGRTWRARVGLATADRPADHDALMGWYIVLGTLPIVVLGLAFQDSIEHSLRNLYLVSLMLVVFALLLGWADAVGAKRRELTELTGTHALVYGFAQALALIPGVSRSGGTITAGLLLGYTREAAARYSFLLAMPAVFGSGLYQLAKAVGGAATPGTPSMAVTLAATVVAFGVGYGVIVWFLKLVSTRSYRGFVVYRIALAAVVVVLLGVGALHALPTA